jgi:hypothetical protein
MPLKPGKSKKVIEDNTRKLIDEGREPKQAYAIAEDMAHRTRKSVVSKPAKPIDYKSTK